MKHNCELIKDLLPMYHDSMCSAESKAIVEEHFAECEECRTYYGKMCESDVVEAVYYDNSVQMQKATDIKKVKKNINKQNRKWVVPIIIVVTVITLIPYGLVALMFYGLSQEKVEVYTDISRYEEFMSREGSGNEHEFKFGMEKYEYIFPEKITDDMNVKDYKMVTYCPWERDYLSYLVVEYDAADYDAEVARLKSYEPMEYIGLYEVTGFEDYTLLTVMSNENHGFIYALTDDEDTIIYVEMIFWAEYFAIENYEQYMPKDYFPEGFNANEGNATMEKENAKQAKRDFFLDPQGFFFWLIDQIFK